MTTPDGRPRRILIVEDEQALALGLTDLFSSAGYAVSTAWAQIPTGTETTGLSVDFQSAIEGVI